MKRVGCRALAGACALLSACARGPAAAPAPRPAPTEAVTKTEPIVVAPDEALPVAELVRLGKLDYQAGDCDTALRRLGRVLAVEPNSPRGSEAAYYAALCEERLGRHERSARLFSSLYAASGAHPLARDSALRGARLWVYLGRYDAASDAATFALRAEAELSPRDRVAAYGALALSFLDKGEHERAEHWTGKARVVIAAERLDPGGVIARDVAQIHFALAELRKANSEAIVFDPLPTDFAGVFEQRAQLLLDAQGAYADVMRAEDARWSAMAGTRLGEMYENLHRDVISAPLPSAVTQGQLSLLFEGAMRLRYVVLLQKGSDILGRTVAMVERTGEASVWAERARHAHERIVERLDAENRHIDTLPHSRDSLRDVLNEMQRRKSPVGGPPDARGPAPAPSPPATARIGPNLDRY